jgi:hypothetical protein
MWFVFIDAFRGGVTGASLYHRRLPARAEPRTVRQIITGVSPALDGGEGVSRDPGMSVDDHEATIINYSSDAAVLRSSYASAVEEIRRSPHRS